MKSIHVAVALAATGLAFAAAAAEPDMPQFRAYEQLTYTLITHDENTARQIPGQVARIDQLLSNLLGNEVHAPNAPTFVLVVPPALYRNYLQPSEYMQGEFVPARFANYLLIQNEANSFKVRSSLYHEYTHVFMRSQLRRFYPVWLDEGLATLVENSRFQDYKVIVGSQLQYDGSWIPLERLFQVDRSSPEYLSENQSKSVHFGAWALVHRAFVKDPAFGKQLFDFLGALNNFNPVEQALPASFGMNAGELDQDMRQYARKATTSALVQIKLPPVKPLEPVAGRDLGEGESLELLAKVMLASGFKPERLAEVIDAAHRKAPESAELPGLRMQLAVRDRNDAALTGLLAEFAPRLTDARVARGVGLALFERVRIPLGEDTLPAAERERLSRRAFELLDRAVMSKPDDVEAIWGYAMLAAQLGQDLPNALQRLNRGLAIANHNPDLAMATALVYEAQGEQKQMIPFLVVTARMTADSAQREWAVKRVNSILATQAGTTPGQ